MNLTIGQLNDQTAAFLYGTPYISIELGISGSLLIVCGTYLMIFGFCYIHLTMAVVGFLLSGALTWIGLVNSKPLDGYSHEHITMFIVPLCIGFVGATLSSLFWKVSSSLVAVLGGLTLILYVCCWHDDLINLTTNGRIGLFIGCPILLVVLMAIFEKQTVLFSLSFSGAFCFILGIDFMAHTGYVQGFWYLLTTKSPTIQATIQPFSVTRMTYIMLSATLLGFIISYLWQAIINLHTPYFGGKDRSYNRASVPSSMASASALSTSIITNMSSAGSQLPQPEGTSHQFDRDIEAGSTPHGNLSAGPVTQESPTSTVGSLLSGEMPAEQQNLPISIHSTSSPTSSSPSVQMPSAISMLSHSSSEEPSSSSLTSSNDSILHSPSYTRSVRTF